MPQCSLVPAEIMGSPNGRGQVIAFTSTDEVDTITTMSPKIRVVIRGLSLTGLCRIIIDHGIPRNEVDGQLTKDAAWQTF